MVYTYYSMYILYLIRYTQDRRKRRHTQLSDDCSTSILQAEEFAKSYLLHNTSPSTNQHTLTSSSSSSTTSSTTPSFFKMLLTLYDESTCELDQALAAIAHSDRVSTGDGGGEAESKRARLEASANHNSSSSSNNTNSNGHTSSSSSSSGPPLCRCTPLKLAVKRLCTQLLVLEKDSVKFHGDKCCSHYFGLMQGRFWAILGDEGVARRCSEDALLKELKSKATAQGGAATILCSPSSSSSSSSSNNNSGSSEAQAAGRQLLQRIHDQLTTEIQVSILLISTLYPPILNTYPLYLPTIYTYIVA